MANFLVEFRHSTQVVPQHVGVRASFSIGPSKPGLQSTVSNIIFSFKKAIFKEFHYYYYYSPFFLAHCAISNFLEHPISQFKQNGVLIKKQQWRIYFESCSRILKWLWNDGSKVTKNLFLGPDITNKSVSTKNDKKAI